MNMIIGAVVIPVRTFVRHCVPNMVATRYGVDPKRVVILTPERQWDQYPRKAQHGGAPFWMLTVKIVPEDRPDADSQHTQSSIEVPKEPFDVRVDLDEDCRAALQRVLCDELRDSEEGVDAGTQWRWQLMRLALDDQSDRPGRALGTASWCYVGVRTTLE